MPTRLQVSQSYNNWVILWKFEQLRIYTTQYIKKKILSHCTRLSLEQFWLHSRSHDYLYKLGCGETICILINLESKNFGHQSVCHGCFIFLGFSLGNETSEIKGKIFSIKTALSLRPWRKAKLYKTGLRF